MITLPIELTDRDVLRFWSHVDRSAGDNECWPWIGCRNSRNYGQFRLPHRTVTAHRVALTISAGFSPGKLSMHSCDNPPCCNPAHLLWGTKSENALDMTAKGRRFKPQANGELHPAAKLTESDVLRCRSAYAAGGTSYERLAKAYGVGEHTMRCAIKGRTWKHLKLEGSE